MLLLAVAEFGVGGCASRRAPLPEVNPDAAPPVSALSRPEPEAAAVEALDAARRTAGLGRRAEAVGRALEILAAWPRHVEADRFLQDLLSGTRSDVWLRDRYAQRLAESPRDPDAMYLAARIEPSRDRQAELFEAAIAADPFHPWSHLGRAVVLEREGRTREAFGEAWLSAAMAPRGAAPWYFLGVTALSHGAPEEAARFLREAAERAPAEARPWLALVTAEEECDRPAAAAECAVRALELAPGDAATLWSACRALERTRSPEALTAAVAILERARPECGDPVPLCEARGRLLAGLGRAAEAVAALDEAVALGGSATDVAVPRRRARIAAGQAQAAVDDYLAGLPYDVLGAGDGRAAAWRELRAAAAADATAPPGDGDLRLAAALTAVGWLAEAGDVLAEAASRRPDDAAVAAARSELTRFLGFLDDLGTFAREVRRRERRGDRTHLAGLVARVRELAEARGFGAEIPAEAGRVRSYALLGDFAASTDAGGPFHDLFSRRGLLFLAGQRSGQGAELMAGRVVSSRRVRCGVLGAEVEYDERLLEGDGLPDGIATIRGGLAGLTLDHDVFVQLEVSRRSPPREVPGLPFTARPGRTPDERRALDTPSEVAERIEQRLAAEISPREFGRVHVDAVSRHERVHVLDASRLVPVGSHPFAALWFALSHGFSGAAMERTLEARAAAGALAECDEPRAALAALASFLPAEEGETPHVAAYRGLMERIVDEIEDDPASFPSIAPGWNIAQQLDRLTRDEARELGRRLCR